jgi:hypothetical protein
VLQDKKRILAVMKDGAFHRAPPMGRGNEGRLARVSTPNTATRWAA